MGIISTDDLRQVVETAKRILRKEKIDRHLAGQYSSTPFMSLKDSYNKKVTFDTWDELEDKIDRLTVMMGKLATRNNGTNRQFKPQIYQSKRRGQSRNFYDRCNYDQWGYQNRYRSSSGDRRYDHFAKDCPTSKEEREIEQIQQMFNLDEGQTSLKH